MTMLSELDRVLAEMRGVFTGMESDAVSVLAQECAGARRVFLAGVGRNGLVLQAFAMRLMHLGVDAHFVGQLSAPPIGAGDLMIAAASIGSLPSLAALIATARRNGARALVISAKPDKVPAAADKKPDILAQFMAITEPRARAEFWQKNKAEIMSAARS